MTDFSVLNMPAKGSTDQSPFTPTTSFVIPAFNEERFIADTLASIHAAMDRRSYEIIVVDNGSTDRTVELARLAGARVVTKRGGTIGALRNCGAAQATGELLVFLDADITLTDAWLPNFEAAASLLESSPKVLSGSMCSVPSASTWLERMWFAPQADDSLSHLGSAHLIVRRDFFAEIEGFDETLETGEDYDFSIRVTRSEGRIHRLPPTVVEHHGFPKTLSQFAKREVWHGAGDAKSLKAILDSRVATAALIFLILHLALLGSVLLGSVSGALAVSLCIALLCLAASLRSYRGQPVSIIGINAAIYYVYFGARALSFFPSIAGTRAKSRTHTQAKTSNPTG